MPTKKFLDKIEKLKEQGESPSSLAGEFVREEIHKIREGEHGARNTKQAIAIGLSEARRAGVDLDVPKKGEVSEETRKQAIRDNAVGDESPPHKVNPNRSKASLNALKKEPNSAASHLALTRHAKAVARDRTPEERSEIAKKAAASRTPAERSASAKKAAATRKRNAK